MTDTIPRQVGSRVFLAEKPWSSNPRDSYLSVVLCCWLDNPDRPFVTWLRNTSGGDATYEGNYFKTLDEALEDFKRRGRP